LPGTVKPKQKPVLTFIGGRKPSSWNVFGAISGTLVGGASTISTAQLAYTYGLSAWWFTLGAERGGLFLGIFLVVQQQQREVETIPQFISHTYDEPARIVASLYSALGMFLQIVAQLLACGAILAVSVRSVDAVEALLSALMVIAFNLDGEMKSAGLTYLITIF